MKNIPYSHQHIEQDDINSVLEVLRSDSLTQGPKIGEFEEALVGYCGARFAVAFSSGTAALHAAYFAAGFQANDETITSPITFLATANAALYLGARPVFIDVESDTGNIDTELIENAITEKTRAIVPVHFAGHPVELEKVANIAKRRRLLLIEDACHALGASYKNNTIGDCRYSDMVVFSFHPVKSITTGEGGAVLTNNAEFHDKLIMFRQHGVTKDHKVFESRSEHVGDWYYEMQYLGYNYRLTDIHSALGISQLRKIDRFIQRRREIAKRYSQAFSDNVFFDLPVERDYVRSAWHLYPIRLKNKYLSYKTKIFAELRAKGLGVQVHYIPVHLQPYYQRLGYSQDLCPKAKDFYERQISIPIYQAMSAEDVEYVISSLLDVLKHG